MTATLPTAGVRIRLLGPMDMLGANLATAQQIRRVVAVLSLHAGSYVPRRDMVEELWTTPPRAWQQTLQTYVMRLRQDLTAAGYRGHHVVRTTPTGYLLDLPPSDVDIHRYTTYVTQARFLHGAARCREALDTLRAAQSLWCGTPLVDVECGPVLTVWVDQVRETHRTAVHLGYLIRCDLGDHRNVLPDLSRDWLADQADEQLAMLLMTTLYLCDRQRDALDVYRRTREALRSGYGLDPGQGLRRVHQQILTGQLRQGGAA